MIYEHFSIWWTESSGGEKLIGDFLERKLWKFLRNHYQNCFKYLNFQVFMWSRVCVEWEAIMRSIYVHCIFKYFIIDIWYFKKYIAKLNFHILKFFYCISQLYDNTIILILNSAFQIHIYPTSCHVLATYFIIK